MYIYIYHYVGAIHYQVGRTLLQGLMAADTGEGDLDQ